MKRTIGKRWLVGAAAILTVAGLFSFVACSPRLRLATYLALAPTPPQPKTDLLKNLSGQDWDEQSTAFTQRLRTRFPAGASDTEVVAGLRKEGFLTSQPGYPTHSATLNWSTKVCGMTARATWSVDAAGKVTDLTGYYHEMGCL